jgi:hypothetical protein
MTARCVVGAMPAGSHARHRCRVLPAIADGRDGISRRTWPVPSRFAVDAEPSLTVRSLSVRRPERSPHRRGCILLAAASLLRLRTRHTAPCYTPLNEGSRDVTGAMWWRRNHSPTRQLSCRQSLMSTRSVQALAPTSPSLVGVFLFQPCSAGIDGGGTISS